MFSFSTLFRTFYNIYGIIVGVLFILYNNKRKPSQVMRFEWISGRQGEVEVTKSENSKRDKNMFDVTNEKHFRNSLYLFTMVMAYCSKMQSICIQTSFEVDGSS